MILVFVLYALFASVFVICKSTLDYAQPLFLVGSRMALAGGLLLGYQFFFQRKQFAFLQGNYFRLIALAFFNIYLTNACEIWGLQYLSSAKTCFLYSLSPFFAALLSFALFNESISSRKWLGLLIGFVGFCPIILHKGSAEELTGSFWIFSLPELAVATAALSSVYGWILLKQVVSNNGLSFTMANGVSMLIGGILALAHSGVAEDWNPLPVTEFLPFLEGTVLLLIISNLAAYNLYGYLLKRYTATFISFAGFTTPLFTAFFGWYFFGEQIAPSFLLSSSIVFLGLYFFYQQELKDGYKAAAPEPA